MTGVGLLETGKCANVAHKHPEDEILNVIALGRRLDALHLLLKGLLVPVGDARQEVLEGLESLLGLSIPLTRLKGVVVDGPETVGDVGDERPPEVVAHRLLHELCVHLF